MSLQVESLRRFVAHGAEELGIALPDGALTRFATYYELLEKTNRSVNLTSIRGAEDVARLHFLDSIALLKATSFAESRVIDIGSGAGFPGIPLKIADPTIELTLLEATHKRVAFLSELCATLEIKAVCLHERAEELANKNDMRERYDIAVSRAVARLNALSELCLPFVRVGGVFIAMKGVDSADELKEAHNAIGTLGAVLQGCHDYTIPGTDVRHLAVLIRKTTKTDDKFPRRYVKIQKTPL